jgi:superfamily II DNA or RNA helicase
MGAILTNWLWLSKAELPHIDSVKERLTVASHFGNAAVKCYNETDTMFGIPRSSVSYTIDSFGGVVDKRIVGPKIYLRSNTALWDSQKELVDRASEIFNNTLAGGVTIRAKTGAGKTICAIEIISRLATRTLIIVPKTDLLMQWKDQIILHTNFPEEQIGLIGGGNKSWATKDIVIATVQSLIRPTYREDKKFRQHFGTVIFDECHRYGLEKFSLVAPMFPARYHLALSATPKRMDDMDKVLKFHVSLEVLVARKPNIMTPSVIRMLYSGSNIVIPRNLINDPIASKTYILKVILRDERRLNAIYQIIRKAIERGRRIVVFSERKVLLRRLEQFLILRDKVITKEQCGLYVQETNDKRRKQLAATGVVILATYKAMGEGTDIKGLDCAIFATPMKDVEQPVGRVRRIMEDKKEPVIIDIIDTNCPRALLWSDHRLQFYINERCTVNDRILVR